MSPSRSRKLSLLVLLLLAACSQADEGETPEPELSPQVGEQLSLEQAGRLVLEQVIQEDTLEHPVIVFAQTEPLQAGDVLHPYEAPGFEPFAERTLVQSEAWFFWIDDEPGAAYQHANRYVLVDRGSGEISVSEEEWWPVLNGEAPWIADDVYWDQSNWFFSTVDYAPTGQGQSSEPIGRAARLAMLAEEPIRNFHGADSPGAALVINGWRTDESLEEDMATSADQMHDLLEEAGFDTTFYGNESDDNPDRDGVPRSESGGPSEQPWRMWMRDRSEQLEPGETLFIYITGHGGVTDDGTGRAGGISETALKEELEGFNPAVNIIVFIDSCKSGSFVDSMTGVADLTITSTDSVQAAYGDIDPLFFDSNPIEDEGMEFTSGFVVDWNAIVGDAARLSDVETRGSRAGANPWRLLSAESFVSARDKDAAFAFGWTGPQFVFGSPATKAGGGYAAEYQARLITSGGQGECGYPEGYSTALEVSIREGEMSTNQPDTGGRDFDEGILEDDFSFKIQREDGGESYEGTLDPSTLTATGRYTYTDSRDCTSLWDFEFTEQGVDLQLGPNSGFTDGISLPWSNDDFIINFLDGNYPLAVETLFDDSGSALFNIYSFELPETGLEAIPVQGGIWVDDGFDGSFIPDYDVASGFPPYPLSDSRGADGFEVGIGGSLEYVDNSGQWIILGEDALWVQEPTGDEINRIIADVLSGYPGNPPQIRPDLNAPGVDFIALGGRTGVLVVGDVDGAFLFDDYFTSDTGEFVRFEGVSGIVDIAVLPGEPDHLSMSADGGTFMWNIGDGYDPATGLFTDGYESGVPLPVSQLNSDPVPGPHLWISNPGGELILIDADNTKLFATVNGERFLLFETNVEITAADLLPVGFPDSLLADFSESLEP